MTAELIPFPAGVEQLIELTLATCPSENTRVMYGVQLRKFLRGGYPLTRDGVARFLQSQREAGHGASTIVSCTSAVRKLAEEAHVRGLLDNAEYYAIGMLRVARPPRPRVGNWLTLEQVEALLELPDRSTYLGKRDAALFSLMVGCGLRREEVSQLRWSHYQDRDGRRCLVDFIGKGNKFRTVPVPDWAVANLDAWQHCMMTEKSPVRAGIRLTAGPNDFVPNPLFIMEGIGSVQLYKIVRNYGWKLSTRIAPHDLRRTLAKLLRSTGAQLEQIQHMLGHAKLETTVRYLGANLELRKDAAAVDRLRIRQRFTPRAQEVE